MIIKMCETKCLRCGRKLTSKESIKRQYGKVCYRIVQLQEIGTENTMDFEHEIIILKDQIDMMAKYIRIQELQNNEDDNLEILDRVRKLELDNNFLKHQIKHKTIIGNSKDSEIDWDLKPEIKKVKDETKIQFIVIIKELKVIFHEGFHYSEVLKPIEPRHTPEIIENLELII